MADPKAPPRSDLAKFLPDARAIRAFERLFERVGVEITDDITVILAALQDVVISAATGEARAQSALDLIGSLGQDLAVIAGTADQKAQQALDTAARAATASTSSNSLAPLVNEDIAADCCSIRTRRYLIASGNITSVGAGGILRIL